MAHCAFRTERRTAGRAVWSWICPRDRCNKKREANKNHQQKYRSNKYISFSFVFHDFSFTCNFLFQLRTLPHPKTQRPSTQAELGDRQVPPSLAGRSENGVAERRNKRRHPWLTDARRRSVTGDDVDVRLGRYLINSSHRIVLKIGLIDYPLRSRNLACSPHTGPENCGALELGARRLWIYDQACVQGHIHARNSHLTLIVDFDFNSRGDIR